MIREVQGDLLKQPVDIIAHQTNCVGAMGAGIAKQIKTQLLSISEYKKYTDICQQKGAELMGQTQLLYAADGRIIANCFGENIPSKDKRDTDYNALLHSLARVRNYAAKNNLTVGLPGLMGCGLAGGDWNIVRDMIYKLFNQTPNVELIICYFSANDYLAWNPDCQTPQWGVAY